jgi:hypothetical protein
MSLVASGFVEKPGLRALLDHFAVKTPESRGRWPWR